jgi:hypothetical protein
MPEVCPPIPRSAAWPAFGGHGWDYRVVMAIRIELRSANCPICGKRMDGTVKMLGNPGQVGFRTAPQDVHCVSGCERALGDNRERMLGVFQE